MRAISTVLLLLCGCGDDAVAEVDAGARADGGRRDGGGSIDGDGGIVSRDSSVDAGPSCDPADPEPTGTVHELRPGGSLEALLDAAAPGDEIRVFGGDYGSVEIADASFDDYVFVRAAEGETPSFGELTFLRSAGVRIEGLHFSGTVALEASSRFVFERVTIDVGDIDGAAFHLRGRGGDGFCSDITMEDSTIIGGNRTVFLHSLFRDPMEWNHDLAFRRNDFSCGRGVCFQLSGARDTVVEDNVFRETQGSGFTTAGAIRIVLQRNTFIGEPASEAAIQIATPGVEWDNYDGVEYMVSEDVLIANNLIYDWNLGIQLSACRRVDIVFNTVVNGNGLSSWRRMPHDRSGGVILTGNTDVRLWNNILPNVRFDSGDPRPTLESHNVVGDGGEGDGLITDEPVFTADYELEPSSPGVDAALVHEDNPTDDRDRRGRGSAPDIGARELGGSPPLCP